MDPNAALDEMRRIAEVSAEGLFDRECPDVLNRLSELVLALDGWISKGGFLPDRWQPKARLRL
jgi:hypothetical protein